MTDAVPLETLAEIWVERWLAFGGGLIVDAGCNNVQISMGLGRWRRPKQPGDHPWYHSQRISHDMWNVGRWRELQELVGRVPGLREAIIHQVALHGQHTGDGQSYIFANRS